jgi:hypothetical protein
MSRPRFEPNTQDIYQSIIKPTAYEIHHDNLKSDRPHTPTLESMYLWLYVPLLDLDRFFSFLNRQAAVGRSI